MPARKLKMVLRRLKAIETERFDLVITDNQMPVMTGYAIASVSSRKAKRSATARYLCHGPSYRTRWPRLPRLLEHATVIAETLPGTRNFISAITLNT